MDFNDQVQAYTAWVNSQLKKRSLHIDCLGQDLKDGKALISIVEIVSGQTLGSLETKDNADNKQKNVEKVLSFMKNAGIRLQHISLQDVLEGNTKTIMQLILALAAHFKPASIGSRRTSFDSSSSISSQARLKNAYRWKHKLRNKNTSNEDTADDENYEKAMNMEIDEEMMELKHLAEHLQKFLLDDIEAEPMLPVRGNAAEENVLLQARLDQAVLDIDKLQAELRDSRLECRKWRSEAVVGEKRCKDKEHELLHLRQQLLRHSLAHDKLETEKAEMALEVEKLGEQVERLGSSLHERERELDESKHDMQLVKTDMSRTISRKEKEISQLKMNLSTAGLLNSTIGEVMNSPRRLSPGLVQPPPPPYTPSQPAHLHQPTIHRSRLAGSKPHQTRRRRPSEPCETRILYFIDREMTPAITSIPKRVGEITLGEFKRATRRDVGSFRFVFKSLDPELGTVKEEIFNDEDLVPGWEGKIVAWIEEVVPV